MSRATSMGLFVFFCAGCLACAGWGSASRCDLESADWSGLRAAAPLRAHVRVLSGESDHRLDMVVRKKADELVLVGLTHYGMRLFIVRQEGFKVRVEGAHSEEQERTAIHVADALQRAFAERSAGSGVGGTAPAIRYSSNDRNPGVGIREPECDYEASVVRVSEYRPIQDPVSSEGVER